MMGEPRMNNGERPISWAMVGGRGSQIEYIHRSAAIA